MNKDFYSLYQTLLEKSFRGTEYTKQDASGLLPLLFPPHSSPGANFGLDEDRIICFFATKANIKDSTGYYVHSPVSFIKSLSTTFGFQYELLVYQKSPKVTVVRITFLPDSLQDIVNQLRKNMKNNLTVKTLVDYAGKTITKAQLYDILGKDSEADVLSSLNTFKKFYYTYNDESVATVYDKVEEDITNGVITKEKADMVLNTLFYMKSMPQPTYKEVYNSPRYYAFNQSPAALPREYRKLYAKEMKWASFDLKCAQYFIAVKILNLDTTLADRVAAGESLWTILGDKMDNKLSKDCIKTGLYAILFGASTKPEGGKKLVKTKINGKKVNKMQESHVIIDNWTSNGVTNAEELFKEFLSIPEINELVEKRDARIKELSKAGKVQPVDSDLTFYHTKGSTLFAYEIQAYEIALMKPLLSYVISSSKYEVALFLHDGLYVYSSYQNLYEGIFISLQRILAKTAKKLNVTAILEREF